MATGDYYTALGVARGASAREIQAAYRRLARKYHPDVTGGDKAAEERFKTINEAYEVLSDGKKRTAYDKWGNRWMQAEQLEQMQRAGGFGAGPGSGLRFDFGREGAPFDGGVFEDLGGGGFGQIFDRFFRGASVRGQTARAKGADIRQGVTVTLAEAYEGTTRTVQLQSQEACSTCGGEGQIGNATCHACHGTGRRAAGKRLEVRIPAGVETGAKIRLRSKGVPAARGGRPGDVVLLVTVAEDPRFERRGAALHTELAVPVTTAALGGEVDVPTVNGKVLLRIPAGTQSGRVFRLAGKGMPIMKSDRHGDLFAKVRVVLPEPLTSEQRDLFQRLRDLERGGEEAERQSA